MGIWICKVKPQEVLLLRERLRVFDLRKEIRQTEIAQIYGTVRFFRECVHMCVCLREIVS